MKCSFHSPFFILSSTPFLFFLPLFTISHTLFSVFASATSLTSLSLSSSLFLSHSSLYSPLLLFLTLAPSPPAPPPLSPRPPSPLVPPLPFLPPAPLPSPLPSST
ncbi:protein trichome birefringence-like 32 [Colletes gigas]|uniref:protein trichome birefringence-like 32 n=1 Tax=Colletes gigas TaxID=935657 RepID=UPI001C9A51C3|nr:protein trichome birefringence-like 32 [Colletes gigas]